MRAVITLTTDFGLTDPFVGIMKGVILNLVPNAQIIDITHQIEPQNIRQAALTLESAHSYFPKNTVHLVVVDPGVGSARRPIAVKTKSATFVGPDNGVLTPAIDPSSRVYELTKSKYFLDAPSSTFHGRDVFAPVVAWIAKGTSLSQMGQKISDPCVLEFPQPKIHKGTVTGEIIVIDRFGNLVSNISEELLLKAQMDSMNLQIGRKHIRGLKSHYSQCKLKEIGCLINSWGKLEIFCREGNAANKLKCRVGTALTIKKD
jgi:S-adenosylmethionine hydrolase